MKTTITLGDTEVARIGLGTNRLRHTPDNVEFVQQAVAAGIGYVDTAHTYADGESEATIGAASPAPPVVGTKGGYAPGTAGPEQLRAQIDESLRRLRTDSIELYYLHRVDPETPLEESLGALAGCREAGKIRHVGISQVDVEQIERARAVVPIAAVQNHYNLSERRYEDVVDHCAREGIVFVPYFPLRDDGGRAVDELAARHGASPAQVKLAWLLARSPTMLPIPGTLSLEHARENLGALELELGDDELAAFA
ncbi:MAG TPA: aldo/keto reductase [Gaiellaceae bacterium]|nr:aldo/keto reductase [Gaiellaceae bacterium]